MRTVWFTTFRTPMVRNSVNTHQNENRFLAFGSLISNAEVENAIISDCIIVCSKKWNIIAEFRFLFSI